MLQEAGGGVEVQILLFLTSVLKAVGGKRHASPALSPTRGRGTQRRKGA